jgi:hypothetical protein
MSAEDIVVLAGVALIAVLAIAVTLLERMPREPTDDKEPTEGDGRWTIEMNGEKFWSGKKGVFDGPNTRLFSVFGYGPNNEAAAKAVEEEAKRPLIGEDGKEIPRNGSG